MANSEIKYCTNCSVNNIEHKFQDITYGKFKRVFNINEKTGTSTCTVCCSGKKTKK
ncbi:MAG: hypothetical protein RR409_09805 [Clostridium sp.]